jgi:hypothetical protein
MVREYASTQFRHYILGGLTQDERAGIEKAYFERADVLDRAAAAEDDLIDDYLSGRLASGEHERFERSYLATPGHRTRVAVARALRAASSAATDGRPEHAANRWSVFFDWPPLGQMALVAAMLLLVAGGAWMLSTRSDSATVSRDTLPTAVSPETSPAPQPSGRGEPAAPPQQDTSTPARATPVVLALSLSPIHVRGADEPARLTIATGTDVVRLYLQGEAGDQRLERGRAMVRTVAGQEVWRGRATRLAGSRPQALARIDVPVARLRPDDYLVELLELDTSNREVERYRYFFRVRSERAKNLP